MSKANIASPRSTSGAGYSFEDHVAAWFMLKMLSGEPIPGSVGQIVRLQWQTASLGWQIDDLLVTATREDGGPHHLTLSVKSNTQVTGNGWPKDFTEVAWKLWRDEDSSFNSTSDSIALVIQGAQPKKFREVWTDLKTWWSEYDTETLIQRARSYRKHTPILESLKWRGEGETEADDTSVAVLIGHLELLEFDFQRPSSQAKASSIAQCRTLLSSSDLNEAEKLWQTLISVAYHRRTGNGSVTLPEILAELRIDFSLKAHPEFEISWKAIADYANDYGTRIQTALPSGHRVLRETESTRLHRSLNNSSVTVAVGESGTGKSALVRSLLNEEYESTPQFWLGPTEVETLLSPSGRNAIGMRHDLPSVLRAGMSSDAVIVIDAAERIRGPILADVKQLIDALLGAQEISIKIVVILREEGWAQRCRALLGSLQFSNVMIGNISPAEVRAALRATNNLQWLASYQAAIPVLTNLRVLGWVIEAGDAMNKGASLSSITGIADQVWKFWTDDDPVLHMLLTKLAQREAEFERTFPLSSIDVALLQNFKNRPSQLPLKRNDRNSIYFTHDLASDWARFQWLKEVADSPQQWIKLATNPLWLPAIRMLSQYLLEEDESSWDAVVAELEETDEHSITLDLLLDGLFLTPQSASILAARTDWLLAEQGERLARLLRRFLHGASAPSISGLNLAPNDPTVGLYLEDQFRSPILAYWWGMAKFIADNRKRVACLNATIVSKVAEFWLRNTPLTLADGSNVPYRKEMALLALETARARQIDQSAGTMYIGDDSGITYIAVLAGAPDIPEEVGDWALELAQRKDLTSDIEQRIADEKQRRRVKREAELLANPELKERERRRREAAPRGLSAYMFEKPLPPWPLGAKNRVDQIFRDVVLSKNAMKPLMEVRPKVAREILLALIIDDRPTERHDEYAISEDLGLAFTNDGYPTAFWKSPFFQFLQVAPDEALQGLFQLVAFCNERWAERRASRDREVEVCVALTFPDGTVRSYAGYSDVYCWASRDSNSTGSLHSALNALERWLVMRLEREEDVAETLEFILKNTESVAFLGVLANVAKFKPELLKGCLSPLLTSDYVYWFDDNRRRQHDAISFDGYQFARQGEVVFRMAKDWFLARFRERHFLEIAVKAIREDQGLAERVKDASEAWEVPHDPKENLETRILKAQLDPANYKTAGNEAIEDAPIFHYPPKLFQAIKDFENSIAPARLNSLVPLQLKDLLEKQTPLTDENAEQLWALFQQTKLDGGDEIANGYRTRSAISAALASLAMPWLKRNADAYAAVATQLKELAGQLDWSLESLRKSRISSHFSGLDFAAYGIFALWVCEDDFENKWEARVVELLLSGDEGAVKTLSMLAYRERARLGEKWWQLLRLGVLWAALLALAPYWRPDEVEVARWQRWRARLLTLRPSGEPIQHNEIHALWKRVGRIAAIRYRNRQEEGPIRPQHIGGPSPALDDTVLSATFGWATNRECKPSKEDIDLYRPTLSMLWHYKISMLHERRDANGEYPVSGQFAYSIVDRIAWIVSHADKNEAELLWKPILELGSAAHYLVNHFISSWFISVGEAEPATFSTRWREMMTFVLTQENTGAEWRPHRDREIARNIMGFNSENLLQVLPSPPAIVAELADLYAEWAKQFLNHDDRDIQAFARFLTTDFGSALRIDGLLWLADTIGDNSDLYRYRDHGMGEALLHLVETTLTYDQSRIRRNPDARNALLIIAAELVKAKINGALTLQERIRQFKRSF